MKPATLAGRHLRESLTFGLDRRSPRSVYRLLVGCEIDGNRAEINQQAVSNHSASRR
jgi:hypothetical protein